MSGWLCASGPVSVYPCRAEKPNLGHMQHQQCSPAHISTPCSFVRSSAFDSLAQRLSGFSDISLPVLLFKTSSNPDVLLFVTSGTLCENGWKNKLSCGRFFTTSVCRIQTFSLSHMGNLIVICQDLDCQGQMPCSEGGEGMGGVRWVTVSGCVELATFQSAAAVIFRLLL